jgi:hypothetical protein
MLDNTNIEIAKLPLRLKAYTRQNPDGSNTILINARHTYEQNIRSGWHEMRHIEADDFHTKYLVADLESYRHRETTAVG